MQMQGGRIDGSMDGCISQQPLPFRQAGSFSHIAVFVVVWRSVMGYWGAGSSMRSGWDCQVNQVWVDDCLAAFAAVVV